MDADITFYLTLAQEGDREAENRAFRLVYDRLRAMARSLMCRERSGHTLQATGLVSEVFVQKLRRISTPIQSREHFYSQPACQFCRLPVAQCAPGAPSGTQTNCHFAPALTSFGVPDPKSRRDHKR